MSIGREKYVSLTTYKKDGTPKALPVWIVELDDGRLGFTTSSSSWKARRLANDDRVTLQPCDQRGRLTAGTEEVTGTGEVVRGELFELVKGRVKAKYGFGYRLITALNAVMSLVGKQRASDAAIVITLD